MNAATLSSKCPIHYATAIALICADWFVYALNTATYIQEFWLVDAGGAVLAWILAAISETYLRNASLQTALTKGLVVGLLVFVPLPLLGTAVGAVALLWHLIGLASRPSA